ncbi:hypothetical protein FH972_013024 [Carpinus fangiana]|uniref:Xylanase inhibitor C-terminal domain-containing protein n=1 Tax=Carpinus fangiana TaxID=176857 RepID=A0A5N6R8N1_9ROSI|nr:hypothetical protein FH972_013024 [Carpinus fangiana]
MYTANYDDKLFSVGFFDKERLTLVPTDVFNNFLFGCGQNNQGLFGGSAGLLGLGRDPFSVVQQTAPKYAASSTASLQALAPPATSPLGEAPTTLPKPSNSRPFFSASRTIINSGDVITRLPLAAYNTLRTAFQKAIKAYPPTDAITILNTCYNLSKYDKITFPKITFSFSGNVNVELDQAGVFFVENSRKFVWLLTSLSLGMFSRRGWRWCTLQRVG